MTATTLLRNSVCMIAIGAAGLFGAKEAKASGFYIQEQSVSGLGAAFAGQGAMPRDASTIYYNPAGMTYLPGTNLNVGVQVIMPDTKLKDTGSTLGGAPVGGGDGGNPYEPTPVPNAYISAQFTDKLWLGLGLSAPFGMANQYDDGWFGRYDSTKTELTTIELSPSMAYKVNNKLSLGGSLLFQYVDAVLKNNLNAGTQGVQTIKGKDTSVGYKLGLLYAPWQGTRIGLDYRGKMNQQLQGSFDISGSTGGDTHLDARADLHLPDIADLSLAQDINDKLTLLGSVSYYGWNAFDRIEMVSEATGATIGSIEQNYRHTFGAAIGGEYKLNNKWTLRAGYQFDQGAARDDYRTSRTPDGDRHWFSAGTTWKMGEKWSADLGATYINVTDETINLTRNISAIPATVKADTNSDIVILSAGLNYKF